MTLQSSRSSGGDTTQTMIRGESPKWEEPRECSGSTQAEGGVSGWELRGEAFG